MIKAPSLLRCGRRICEEVESSWCKVIERSVEPKRRLTFLTKHADGGQDTDVLHCQNMSADDAYCSK